MATYSSFKKITSESVIDGAVTTAKFADLSVNSAKIADGAIATADIADGAVGTTQLASAIDLSAKTVTYRAITAGDIADGAVTNARLAAGASTTNLGYTPVSTGGGVSVSGQLKISAASAGSTGVGTSTAGAGIYFPAATTVGISTSSANRLTVNASGQTIEPNRPAFYACGLGGWYYGNTFGGSGWRELTGIGWEFQTQGGVSVTSNCRVTAPVSGYYWFYLQSYYYNDNNSTPGYTHWNIGRNGSPNTQVSGRHPHTIFAHGLPNNHAPGIMVPVEMYMSAGDFASPQPYNANGPGRFHADHSLWCGFLIG